MIKLPEWWPDNPYPESVFPMKRAQYSKIVPNNTVRTALSGMLGREFWDIASRSIWDATQEHKDQIVAALNAQQPKRKTCEDTHEIDIGVRDHLSGAIEGDKAPCPDCPQQEMEFDYSFCLWPDEHWDFPPSVFEVFECLKGRIEFVWTKEHFEKVRSELSHHGLVMHEISRRLHSEEEVIL